MKWIFHWGPAVFIAGIIFWLSHKSNPPGAGLAPDWLGHFGIFFLLGAALAWGESRAWTRAITGVGAVKVWLLTTGYGLFDEIHQSLIPGRDPNPVDLLVDSVGGLAAALFFKWLSKR